MSEVTPLVLALRLAKPQAIVWIGALAQRVGGVQLRGSKALVTITTNERDRWCGQCPPPSRGGMIDALHKHLEDNVRATIIIDGGAVR